MLSGTAPRLLSVCFLIRSIQITWTSWNFNRASKVVVCYNSHELSYVIYLRFRPASDQSAWDTFLQNIVRFCFASSPPWVVALPCPSIMPAATMSKASLSRMRTVHPPAWRLRQQWAFQNLITRLFCSVRCPYLMFPTFHHFHNPTFIPLAANIQGSRNLGHECCNSAGCFWWVRRRLRECVTEGEMVACSRFHDARNMSHEFSYAYDFRVLILILRCWAPRPSVSQPHRQYPSSHRWSANSQLLNPNQLILLRQLLKS